MFAPLAETSGAQVIVPQSGSDILSLQAGFTIHPPYRSGSDSETDLEEVECSYNSHERVHEYRPLEADGNYILEKVGTVTSEIGPRH
jgi:hypothetical protein